MVPTLQFVFFANHADSLGTTRFRVDREPFVRSVSRIVGTVRRVVRKPRGRFGTRLGAPRRRRNRRRSCRAFRLRGTKRRGSRREAGGDGRLRDRLCGLAGTDPGLPQSLARIDVSDACDTLLVEQERLDRRRPSRSILTKASDVKAAESGSTPAAASQGSPARPGASGRTAGRRRKHRRVPSV